MPANITVSDSIHNFLIHSIKALTFSGTETILLYNISNHNNCVFHGVISNGSRTEKLNIEIVTDSSGNAGMEINRIAVNESYLDLSFSTGLSGNALSLTITNNVGIDSNALKYYIIPGDMEG